MSPPGITLQVILELVLNSKSESCLGQYTTKSILGKIRKLIGYYMWNMDTTKMAQASDGMNTYNKKGVLIKSTTRYVIQEGMDIPRHKI